MIPASFWSQKLADLPNSISQAIIMFLFLHTLPRGITLAVEDLRHFAQDEVKISGDVITVVDQRVEHSIEEPIEREVLTSKIIFPLCYIPNSNLGVLISQKCSLQTSPGPKLRMMAFKLNSATIYSGNQ